MPLLTRAALAAAALASCAQAQLCPPRWSETFANQDLTTSNAYDVVTAALVFDADGPGPGVPSLYIAGPFGQLGSRYASRVARWDGHVWTDLSAGLASDPYSLAAFDDDGDGPHLPQLYAGAESVYRFDGNTWSLVGSPLPQGCPTCTHSWVRELLSFDDDGPGPNAAALYAVQYSFDDPPVGSWVTEWTSVYRLDGADWTLIHQSPGYNTGAAIFDDDGPGPLPPALLIGTQSYQPPSFGRIEQFRAGAWSDLLNQGNDAYPAALCVADDDGAGPILPALYIGGRIQVGPTQVPIARWDGTNLTAVASAPAGFCNTLASMDADGTGEHLYSVTMSVSSIYELYRRDGETWNLVAPLGGLGWVSDMLAVDDDGPGPNPRSIFVVGSGFAGTPQSNGVARIINGAPRPPGDGLDQPARALIVGDTGIGRRLYAGGTFSYAGPVPARGVAAWQTGVGWTALGAGLAGEVRALRIHNDGRGLALFAAGYFTADGAGAPLNHIARWDGTAWANVGAGLDGPVYVLGQFNDGTGLKLFAGGDFTTSGATAVAHIARWDGTAWTPLGAGTDGPVAAILGFNDGTGSRLFVGGQFAAAGGSPAANIASWNGSTWAALGGGVGVGSSANEFVSTLVAHNDGAGPALYAGGYFERASGLTCNSIARWRAGAWSALGTGLQAIIVQRSGSIQVPGVVRSLISYDDDGPGPRAAGLYAGGQFNLAGNAPASCLARWDTTAWTYALPPLGGSSVDAMALMDDDGAGPAPQSLYVAGQITSGSGQVAPLRLSNIARLAPCPPCYANCDNSTQAPVLNIADFICFQQRFAAGDPYANCDGSVLAPVLNVADFVCFQQHFAAGCP